MANKFDLQIAASEKRIEKFQKSVQTYEARLQKAIKAIIKAGVYVTADDMVNTGNPKSRYAEFKFNNQSNLVKMVGYDFVCSACNAADYKYQNEHDLQKEIEHLAELKGQRDAMESKKEENATLRNALANALSEYKEEWLKRMEEWHKQEYKYIRENRAEAKARYERAKVAEVYFTKTRGLSNWFRRTNKYKMVLSGICSKAAEIIGHEAARYASENDYLTKKKADNVKEWELGLARLTERVKRFNVDETRLALKDKCFNAKVFEAVLTDGKPRAINVRVIWAAEHSVLVTPHTRYIATERMTK